MSEAQPKDKLLVVKRIGPVSVLKRTISGHYYIQTRDALKRKEVRKSAKTKNLEDAIKAARKWKHQLESDKERALQLDCERLTVEQALRDGVEHGGQRNRQKSDEYLRKLNSFVDYFLTWNGGKIRHWQDMDTHVVNRYINHLVAKGIAPKSRVHYISPIQMASKYWASVDGKKFQRLYIANGALHVPDPRKVFLTFKQLNNCIAIARQHNLRYAVIGFILGGMAGLRLREIAFIQRSDFYSQSGTIRIRRAKNEYSPRSIPLLPEVAVFLDSCFTSDPSPYLVHWQNGEQGDNNTVAKEMRAVLNLAGHLQVQPKEAARKTFINWARPIPGMDRDAFESYTGHRPANETAKSYLQFNESAYRRLVIAPIQQEWERLISQQQYPPARIVEISEEAPRYVQNSMQEANKECY